MPRSGPVQSHLHAEHCSTQLSAVQALLLEPVLLQLLLGCSLLLAWVVPVTFLLGRECFSVEKPHV